MDVIKKIKLFSFNYKDNEFFDSSFRHKIGFLAQQLWSIDPAFVNGTPEDEVMMSPNLLPIVAYLVKAVQELSAEIIKMRSTQNISSD
jgi:hypothetical protein